jgi:deoxyribodipyrimidine photo-lyase
MTQDNLKTRIKIIGSSNFTGKCVIYVMSRDQRVSDNHALLSAQKHALAKKLPLAVIFCLQENSGYRSREHFQFMIQGLSEIEKDLEELNIPFMMLIGNPAERLKGAFHHLQPDAVYFDFNPLRGPRNLIEKLAEVRPLQTGLYVVDTHNVIPIWVTSDKQEVGAYTIRPKIHKKFEQYLQEPEKLVPHPTPWSGPVIKLEGLQQNIVTLLENIAPSGISVQSKSGERAAYETLEKFIKIKLASYATTRNDPTIDGQSNMSPYLHFGQISSLRIALRLREEALKSGGDLHLLASSKMPKSENSDNKLLQGIDDLIEELIVRKELSDNFCYYNKKYDTLAGAPLWAQNSLEKHILDHREFLYEFEQLEQAKTHDKAWNAAQLQLTKTGKIHGYMRMYWAKKVLEWTESPEQAIAFLIRLNDAYSIDGGDPNGYTGIMWSVAGVHDRPWIERDIFGVIRYMNYAGLKRKFDIATYEKQWLS